MADGYSIDFGRFVAGYCTTYTHYGKETCKDGTVYHFWKLYVWVKNGGL